MKGQRHVPWFNPRQMNDATVLALNTGRSALLAELLQIMEQRSTHPGQISHWLITGPRGAGKSYFLRLLQVTLKQEPLPKVQLVLLPEELPNIFAPHELLAEICRLLEPSAQHAGTPSRWRVDNTGQLWEEALTQLLSRIQSPLLVVGIENFDALIAQAFSSDVDNSRLRHLMSNEPRLMFVASAVQGDFDEQHNQRLFRQFDHRSLPHWTPIDHRHYLDKRARQQGSTATAQQLNRIDAYSRYTGGNARAGAVLAATILDVNDPLDSADDLDAAVEKMSDHYRALIARIPNNTKKLFDALVRGGEPASQTELAERTGARQSDISRAFAWLVDNGYVNESREPGQKTKHYRVLDRLLVQFYRMRYLHPGQRSRLAVMADLLADTLNFADKGQFVSRNATQAVVWHELDITLAQAPGHETEVISQLGDAVADAAMHDSPANAFALGLDILQGLAARPHLPAEAALRGLWIDMIEMAVPWGVMRDLLGEWPQLWPEAEHNQVHQLKEVLLAWLTKLEAVQTGDTSYQDPNDPDLVTTLTALEQALSPKTRHRLGLLQPAASERT
ncbi:AAA family ATPase [Rhodoferax sp.]|uniref:AAA family ATPase n=1 Tax=Rhodoferax sp. TaxID=50421 RepID=UPI00261275C9|nr:AAA family ATPase [Rhodoferax sp.]MDD5479342.1 hypothetical protein [Rhodoferax sp.]